MNLNNFEVLGDVEVSVQYRTYLGCIHLFDKVNDEPYNNRITQQVRFVGYGEMGLSIPIQKATYKVIKTFPNADYYVPILTEKKVEGMLFGSFISEKVQFRVYKFAK